MPADWRQLLNFIRSILYRIACYELIRLLKAGLSFILNPSIYNRLSQYNQYIIISLTLYTISWLLFLPWHGSRVVSTRSCCLKSQRIAFVLFLSEHIFMFLYYCKASFLVDLNWVTRDKINSIILYYIILLYIYVLLIYFMNVLCLCFSTNSQWLNTF